MRRIIVAQFASLDGVIEDPGGAEDYAHGGWTFKYPDDEGYAFKSQELADCDAQLLGRVTYEAFAKAWPSMKDDAGFADKMNAMPKYVVSTTLSGGDWGPTTVISEDVPAAIAAIKQQEGGDILVQGSAQLVHTLQEHDLVDEWRLTVFPIVLRSGKRVWGEGVEARGLELAGCTRLKSGSLYLTYRAATAAA